MKTKVTSVLAVVMLLATGVAPVAAASAAGATQAECSFPLAHADATGTEVTVEQVPERVTVLGPSAAQTMWEIGAESQVVGAPADPYTAYLDGIDEKENVSAPGRAYVNPEKVVATEPDLVLAPNVIPNETVEQLRDSGLTVFKFADAKSVKDIYAKTERTGQLTGNCEGAAETVAWMEDRVQTVERAVEGAESARVFVSQGGGWTAGEGTFIHHLVELAGGTNVAAEANVSGYQQISEEVIVEQDPEWIVQLGQFGAYPKTEAYNGTYAVRNDQVLTVNGNYISQPGPRVVHPLTKMAKAFHPDAYAEANATTTADSTATATATETTEGAMADERATTTVTTDSTDDAAGDSSSSVPGFGAPAALAALAGATLLARRH